jgi:small subunit ribosomal protein S20
MATHVSAEKRHKQSLKKQSHNRFWKSRIKVATKNVLEAISKKDKKKAEETLRKAVSEIKRARKEGVIHFNNASRKVARLSRHVSGL